MDTYRPILKMDIWQFGVKHLVLYRVHKGRPRSERSVFLLYAADEGTAYCCSLWCRVLHCQ